MGAPKADLTAFCELEWPRLVGTLGLYCGNTALAEELAQEALARACANWSSVGGMAAPGAWTHRVAINLANSHFRRLAAERRALRRRGHDASEPVADDSEAVAIRAAVRALPDRQRAALVLRYWGGFTGPEVAEMLGTSAANVHQLCHRAVSTLRLQLDVDLDGEQPRDDFLLQGEAP